MFPCSAAATASPMATTPFVSMSRPAAAKGLRSTQREESSMNQSTDSAVAEAGERVQFDALHGAATDGGDVNLDMILDVPVTLAMEVGRTRISIRNLLQLNQGSVVELDRAAGEPLDVFVNGTLVAHGEVVVINEKFGIRLTDVISPAERVRKLR